MSFTKYVKSLAADTNCPSWVKPLDRLVAQLVFKRYGRRIAARTKTFADSDYAKYLRSPHWVQFRMAVMVLSGGKCCRCGDVADHVHHLTYVRRGRERLEDVEPLCERCHADEHGKAVAS